MHFSTAVLAWFDHAGRKYLPWQKNITPYRVWLSEIMLQQTQVSTVIPYFEKFTAHYPDIQTLANAKIDDVLALWTGLGYYSRARNLHNTAKIITEQYHAVFPDDVDALSDLPGIGRSTAAAIVSIAYQKRAAILDGNVKRVLARFHAVSGWPSENSTEKKLWHYAEQHTPKNRTGDYTQAMMDLGATVCTRSKPRCTECPLQKKCTAYRENNIGLYPGKKPKKILPAKATTMLILRNAAGEILLQQRSPTGLWGGLWCLPEITETNNIQNACYALCHCKPTTSEILPSWRHSFSHYHLDITPVVIDVQKTTQKITEANTQWIKPELASTLGMPAPTVKLLAQIAAC